MHRKDLSRGAIVSIRRDESPFVEGVFTLKADPMATYCLEDADTGEAWCSQEGAMSVVCKGIEKRQAAISSC